MCYVHLNTHPLFQLHRNSTLSLIHPQGREQTPSFPNVLAGAWRDSSRSIFQPSKALNMKQKRPRALTNEPQQAWCQGMDSWAAGGLISLAISNQKKACILPHFACFTHPWQLGCPMLHLGQCPWRNGSAGAGHQAAILSPWPGSSLPALGWDRQAFVCLEPAKPGCDCELESDLSWAPAPVRKNEQAWGVFSAPDLNASFVTPSQWNCAKAVVVNSGSPRSKPETWVMDGPALPRAGPLSAQNERKPSRGLPRSELENWEQNRHITLATALGRRGGGEGEGACIQHRNKAPVPVTWTGSHQGTLWAHSLPACCRGRSRNVLVTRGLDSATYDLQDLGQMI